MPTKQPSNPRKRLPPETESEPVASIATGDISHVGRDVNIAGKIIQYIENRQRDLTYGETVEKDLQVEINELRRGIDDYFERLKEQVNAAPTSAPYKELEAYTLSEARIFFGRDEAIRKLYAAMKLRRLTVLQAESGAGKTSLLQAGILPCAIAEQHLAILVRPQFENPGDAIKKTFVGNLELAPKLARAPLVDFLRRVYSLIGHPTTLYLILDQFEEFFSKKTLEADRQKFIADLAACLNDTTLNVHWVISITTDVFGQLGKFEPYIRDPFSKAESLYLFTRKQAAEVIQCSAEQYGLSFEQELLDCILNDLCQQQGGSIAPTQIQLVCTALYNDHRDKGDSFTCEHYARMGGAQGILHNYVGSVLNRELPPEERNVAHKIFEALVTSEKKRLIRTKSDLELDLRNKGVPPETLETTLNHLVAGRLLRRYGDDPHCIQYEIVHDYLLKEIEIDPGIVRIKQAEELIEDGLRVWRRNRNLLLGKEHLALIDGQFDQQALTLDAEQAEFLLLSAAANNGRITRWLSALPGEKLPEIIAGLGHDLTSSHADTRRRAKQIAWALRAYLPANTYRQLYLEKLFRKSWIPILILLVIAFSLRPVRNWLSTPLAGEWEQLPRFEEQTHADLQAMSVALALDDPDWVMVSDRTPGVLFLSTDGGERWKRIAAGEIDQAVLALSLRAQGRLYALTSDSVWRSEDSGRTWTATGPIPLSGAEELTSISVNPRDADQVYIGGDNGKIYLSVDQGKTWEEMGQDGYSGKRIKTMATNGKILAVATEEGLWSYSRETDQWLRLSLRECTRKEDPSDRVTALAIPYPLDDPPIGNAIGIWAAIPGVGICDADTENAYPQSLIYTSPDSFSSITATGKADLDSHGYSATQNGMIRDRTWFSHDSAWWKIRIQSLISQGG